MFFNIGLQATISEISCLHDLPKLLEDVSLAVRARMWYVHDGAPVHFGLAVRDVTPFMSDG
jgi:hypothetical protein